MEFLRRNSIQIYTAKEAKTRLGEFLDLVQREPVRVKRHDRVVGVMVNAQDFEAMRAFYANRLQHTLEQSGVQAMQTGLTEQGMAELLHDES